MKRFTALALVFSVLAAGALCACDNEENQTSVEGSKTESTASEVSQESENPVSDISAVTSKPEITTSQLEQINSFLNQYKDIPDFSAQSETIDAEEISKDKTITLISDNSNNSFTSLVASQFKTAANSAGFAKVSAGESDGTAAYYNQVLSDAVGSSDIIIMYGDINKDTVAASIEQTQANGIKVLSAGNVGKGEKDHYVDYSVPINYQLAGKLLADWAVSKNKAKVNALAINNSDSTLSSSIYTGFADEFQKYVTSGYCTVLSGSKIEVGNGLATKIRQAIDNDPNLNYVIVLDDSMISDAVSGVEQSGKSNIKIISTGGSVEAFNAAESGKIEMLVAQSYEWTAYAMVDYALRVMNHSSLPEEQDVPVRIVTEESIKNDMKNNTYSDIDGFYEICFGDRFVSGYSTLWDL
ncbi:MAG: substrate-binding domain-containing protein [Clostridia bacterium]|nr:substrate-binding domain-containing protein [Clostridia bacterium]